MLFQIIIILLIVIGVFWLVPRPKPVVNADQALQSVRVIEHRFDDLSKDWEPTTIDDLNNYFYRPTLVDDCQYYRSHRPVDRSEVPSGAWRQFQNEQTNGTLGFNPINNYLLAKNCGDWKLVDSLDLPPIFNNENYNLYEEYPPPETDSRPTDHDDSSRQTDINQITVAISDYVTANNELPVKWSDINAVVSYYDDALTANGSINAPNTAINNKPSVAGDFTWSGLFGATTTAQQVQLYAATSGNFDITKVNEDLLIIAATAKCAAGGSHGGRVEPGGQRQMVIVYKLKADDLITCKDVKIPG